LEYIPVTKALSKCSGIDYFLGDENHDSFPLFTQTIHSWYNDTWLSVSSTSFSKQSIELLVFLQFIFTYCQGFLTGDLPAYVAGLRPDYTSVDCHIAISVPVVLYSSCITSAVMSIEIDKIMTLIEEHFRGFTLTWLYPYISTKHHGCISRIKNFRRLFQLVRDTMDRFLPVAVTNLLFKQMMLLFNGVTDTLRTRFNSNRRLFRNGYYQMTLNKFPNLTIFLSLVPYHPTHVHERLSWNTYFVLQRLKMDLKRLTITDFDRLTFSTSSANLLLDIKHMSSLYQGYWRTMLLLKLISKNYIERSLTSLQSHLTAARPLDYPLARRIEKLKKLQHDLTLAINERCISDGFPCGKLRNTTVPSLVTIVLSRLTSARDLTILHFLNHYRDVRIPYAMHRNLTLCISAYKDIYCLP
jgi:hypothetical protein